MRSDIALASFELAGINVMEARVWGEPCFLRSRVLKSFTSTGTPRSIIKAKVRRYGTLV